MVKDLYSIFTTVPSHRSYMRGPELLTARLNIFLFSDETYSHAGGPPGKKKRLSPVKLSLIKACSGIPAHIEEKYMVPGLHVIFARTEATAQLICLSTKDGLRGTIEKRNYYAADLVFQFAAGFTDRSLGLWEGVLDPDELVVY